MGHKWNKQKGGRKQQQRPILTDNPTSEKKGRVLKKEKKETWEF